MKTQCQKSGFTLTEVIIVTFLMAIVITGATYALIQSQRMWHSTNNELEGTADAIMGLQKLIGGANGKPGLRMAEYNQSASSPNIIVTNGNPERIEFDYDGTRHVFSLKNAEVVSEAGDVFCRNVEKLEFQQDPNSPGAIKVDLTVRRNGSSQTATQIRMVSWVALRNR